VDVERFVVAPIRDSLRPWDLIPREMEVAY
jgi:hypothetical protein